MRLGSLFRENFGKPYIFIGLYYVLTVLRDSVRIFLRTLLSVFLNSRTCFGGEKHLTGVIFIRCTISIPSCCYLSLCYDHWWSNESKTCVTTSKTLFCLTSPSATVQRFDSVYESIRALRREAEKWTARQVSKDQFVVASPFASIFILQLLLL